MHELKRMSGVRKLELKTQILGELRRVNGIPLAEKSLLNLLRILVTPAPLATEMQERLREMEEARLVISTRDTLENEIVKWSITDVGRAKLAELEARGNQRMKTSRCKHVERLKREVRALNDWLAGAVVADLGFVGRCIRTRNFERSLCAATSLSSE
jgi:hypothetical protein